MQRLPEVDVEIVGAGFAGLSCARACAARGLRTVVWERKSDPGDAVHTTGLLVKELADEEDLPLDATRKIRGVRLYGPSLRWIDLDAPGYFFLATDTGEILRDLARRAEEAGAEIRCGRPFPGSPSARFVVGADGPRSRVARLSHLGTNRSFLAAVELELEGAIHVEDRLHVFLDSRVAPGYIGWVVPGVGITQVGLACRRPARPNPQAFLERVSAIIDLDGAREVGRRGGPIPVGGPVRPFATDRVVLIGDAAGLVSPLTGGGIQPALRSGRAAGVAIAGHLLDGARAPGRALADVYRRSPAKRALRIGLDWAPPNALIDGALDSHWFRALAQTVFFHHRGLLEPAAWRDLVRSGATDQAT